MATIQDAVGIAVLDVFYIINSKRLALTSLTLAMTVRPFRTFTPTKGNSYRSAMAEAEVLAEASRSQASSNVLALLNPAHAASVHSHSSAAQRGTGMFTSD